MTVTYFHGTNSSDAVVNALVGNGMIRGGFHLTSDISTARNYGSAVVAIELEADFTKAHVGLINKEGNFNSAVGSKFETVLKTPAAVNELYFNLIDVKVIY